MRRFLVTHIHRDHYTQAVALRREFGMRVALGRGEQHGLDTINDPDQPEGPIMAARLRRAGAEAVLAKLSGLRSPHLDMSDWALPDDWIDDGERLAVGERTLVAVETPGHTRGHLVFADEAADIAFCGDHVLPRITPSIGLEPDPNVSPLADFLASLELMRKRPDARMLAAHGPVGMRVHERVDELIAHHATPPGRHPRRARRGPQHRVRRGGRDHLDPSRAHAVRARPVQRDARDAGDDGAPRGARRARAGDADRGGRGGALHTLIGRSRACRGWCRGARTGRLTITTGAGRHGPRT